jgi:uncharacterized YigZ family protein
VGGPYRVPATAATAELREQGSVFLAVLRAAADEAEARAVLGEIAALHPDATHHCWASRFGAEPARERAADAGEPRGTAGEPILRALRGAGLSDCVCVVSRWFGGTKLGKGGLARAYAEAARQAIAGTPTLERAPTLELELTATYDAVGAIKRLLRPPQIELVAESYGELATLRLRVWREREAELRAELAAFSSRIETVDARRSGR